MDDVVKDRISLAVSSGAAVCLLGAGFSRGAADGYEEEVPGSGTLTEELKELLQIPVTETASLSEIADFAEEDAENRRKLRQHLMKRLTCTSATPDQKVISSAPWRAIFTTNFDDVVERSRKPGTFAPITPTTDTRSISSTTTPLYYLHGRALDLVEKDIDPSIVISERNYLRMDSRNRQLYERFFNEVFAARIILIIGYSLRDLEIASGLLTRSDALKDKTFIICAPDESDFARSRLSKFGTPLPIGVQGLAELLRSKPASVPNAAVSFQFLDEVVVDSHMPGEIGSEDFVRLILQGELDLAKFRKQTGADAFVVERTSSIARVFEGLGGFTQRFIVSSDFGNGKTVFLKQLAVRALEKGFRVLNVRTQLAEAFQEFDQACNSGEQFLVIIDDVVRHREIAKYIGSRLNDNVAMVCTTRGEYDEKSTNVLESDLGGSAKFIDLNRLEDSEIIQWDRVLERWGYWGARIQINEEGRRVFLKTDCAAENRSIVLSLFRESKIAHRIDQIVEFFLRDTRVHLRSFAALLISSLAQRHVAWERLVEWVDIDEAKLKKDLSESEINDLFVGGRSWNALTSSQLADFILRTRFVQKDRDVLVEVYSTIVLRSADSAYDDRSGFDSRENLKELMKFRFLTRLFGDDADAISLIGTVYKRLSSASRIRDNPQFWLQFAMSRMAVDDLTTAETYLESALGLAKKRGFHYSPFQILDQLARLYIRKNTIAGKVNSSEIEKAVKDLSDLLTHNEYEVIYPFRAVPLISDFLEKHIDALSPDLKKKITGFLTSLRAAKGAAQRLPRSQKGETEMLMKELFSAEIILRNA